MRDAKATEDVDAVDEVPVVRCDLLEGRVAQDAGVVDDDVDLAERVHGGLDDLGAILDRVVVGDGFTAGVLDLLDDGVRRRGPFARAVVLAAEVVDDHLRPARGEEQRMGLPETITSTGDDDDASIEPQKVRH